MKKITAFIILLLIVLTITGCTSNDEDVVVTADDVSEQPENAGDNIESDDSFEDQQELTPESSISPVIPPSSYKYSSLTLENNGLSMDYPSHWERRPAEHSVYFISDAPEGEVPGRIVVTYKTLSKIRSDTRLNQLKKYFSNILDGFETYEWSDVYTDQPFMGDDKALSVTYSGTKDGIEYKGYVIIGAYDTTLYVFHFRCDAASFDSYSSVINRVRDSITITLPEKD